ncbi:MAG TPA: hypothetical protein K8U77_00945 [Slackia equolifaciens]|uniref:Uncharacterized protein n=1 Tax=Slackia equolifaciens TaxID=498718 RepID=A0A9D2UV59_9ACTN|nr:hypothetical protein [Slackia equolifaciens]
MRRRIRGVEQALAEHYRAERQRIAVEAREHGTGCAPESFVRMLGQGQKAHLPRADRRAFELGQRRANEEGRVLDAGKGCEVAPAPDARKGREVAPAPDALAAAPEKSVATPYDRSAASVARFLPFAASQVRFVPKMVWASQLVMVAIVLVTCAFNERAGFSACALSVFGAALAGCGLPALVASKTHRMAELEYACLFDCGTVAIARMLAVGCASALEMVFVVLLVPSFAQMNVLLACAYATVPFLLSCAGGMLLARRTRSSAAGAIMVVFALIVACACVALASALPQMYMPVSAGAWAVAAAAGAVWAVRETHALLGGIAAGIDAYCETVDERVMKGSGISWS